eukprot:scaffold14557_cov133-Skeletonema_menzelii.AAC.5
MEEESDKSVIHRCEVVAIIKRYISPILAIVATVTFPAAALKSIALFSISSIDKHNITATMATGVQVGDEVVKSFSAFKLQQEPYNLRYFIYEIKDKKTITIEKQGAREKTYDDLVEELPENDCRYVLIDIDFESSDGRPTSKIVFITWNPDTAKIRSKMLYSGSKEALKSALTGVGIHINATDHSELDFETAILPALKKFT